MNRKRTRNNKKKSRKLVSRRRRSTNFFPYLIPFFLLTRGNDLERGKELRKTIKKMDEGTPKTKSQSAKFGNNYYDSEEEGEYSPLVDEQGKTLLSPVSRRKMDKGSPKTRLAMELKHGLANLNNYPDYDSDSDSDSEGEGASDYDSEGEGDFEGNDLKSQSSFASQLQNQKVKLKSLQKPSSFASQLQNQKVKLKSLQKPSTSQISASDLLQNVKPSNKKVKSQISALDLRNVKLKPSQSYQKVKSPTPLQQSFSKYRQRYNSVDSNVDSDDLAWT